jgi:hypothetical protein
MKNKSEYDEWFKKQNSFWDWFKKYMQPFHMFALVVLVSFSWWLISENKISANWVVICLLGIVMVIIFKGKKQEKAEPIPEPVIKEIARYHMEERLKKREFPYGTKYYLDGYCKMQFQGDWGGGFKAWKWAIGIKIIYPDGLKKSLRQLHDVYTGICTGLTRCPEGFDGTQAWDLKVLMPQIITTKEEKEVK